MKLSDLLLKIKYDGYIESVVHKLRTTKHVMIFGAGNRAQFLALYLLKQSIEIESFVINEKYFKKEGNIQILNQSIPIKCYEVEVQKNKEITIVLGIAQSMIDLCIFENPNISAVIPISIGTREDYLITKEFYLVNAEQLDMLYDLLADEYSRKCMYAHFYGRLTGKDFPFSPNASSDPQYVFDEFMKWRESECYVDCGAYIGDSIEEFMIKMPSRIVKEFSAYALEPEMENFRELKEKYKNNHKVKCLCLGAYSKKERLSFLNGAGELSAISELGDTIIDVDSIDNVLGDEKATFIKMDIEGGELEAIKGAQKQITLNSPRLAICVYHKKEDLYTIPQLIMEYNADYDFYLRAHSSMPTELTLFCIPK